MDTSSFEVDLDGWTTGGMDQPFTRWFGNTPSGWNGDTGPQGAAEGSYYVYAETSSANTLTNFDLQKTFPGQELYGIAFQYHMHGDTMGSAVLESSADGTSWALLWYKSRDQGDQWLLATVYAASGQTMLRYVYTCVSNSLG